MVWGVHKGVVECWRIEMAIVWLLVAALREVTTALKRGLIIAMTVIPRLVVLPLTLVEVGWLLENESGR